MKRYLSTMVSEKTDFTDDGRTTDNGRPRDDSSSAVQLHKAELKKILKFNITLWKMGKE